MGLPGTIDDELRISGGFSQYPNKLGVSVLKIKLRQMYRSNGLIDDIHVHGTPEDYLQFSEHVKAALASTDPVVLKSESSVYIEILKEDETEDLFTSLQNEENEYFSEADWDARNILRLTGPEVVLKALSEFLTDLSGRGDGYSYLSEYSVVNKYSEYSPQWRLYVEDPSYSAGGWRH